MLDDVLWDERERHSHVLVAVQWGFEVHVFDVGPGKTGPFGANGAVPKKFGRDHIGGSCRKVKGIADQIATHPDSDLPFGGDGQSLCAHT